MDKKYKLTSVTATIGRTQLYQIRAVRSFGDVKAGDCGGFIESESNLSHSGDCWVYDLAKVHDNSIVYGNAKIQGNAQLHDNAQVYGNSIVTGDVHLHGKSQVYGNAEIRGTSRLYDKVQVYGNIKIKGASKIYGEIQLYSDCDTEMSDVVINYDNHRCDYAEKCDCMGGEPNFDPKFMGGEPK